VVVGVELVAEISLEPDVGHDRLVRDGVLSGPVFAERVAVRVAVLCVGNEDDFGAIFDGVVGHDWV